MPVHPYTSVPPLKRPKQDTALSVWLKQRGVSRFQLAQTVGCDPKMVGLWADGQCIPSLVYAFKLEQATAGAVPVASWLGTEIGKIMWRGAGADWDGWMEQRREERLRNGKRRAAERKARTP